MSPDGEAHRRLADWLTQGETNRPPWWLGYRWVPGSPEGIEIEIRPPIVAPAPGPGAGALDAVWAAVAASVEHYTRARTIEIPGVHRPFTLGGRTAVMGVVNVTPDSFSDGGRYVEPDRAVQHGLRLVEDGADLLDIGGESTRPGAGEVTDDAEWARIGPVLAALRERVAVPLSVDTRHAAVAARAIDAGADLVNDVSGLRDAAMRRVVARTGAPAVVMHMRGTPETMQSDLAYRDVVGEVYAQLADAVRIAEADGIDPGRLLIDPGLGFGKSAVQSLELLDRVGEFRSMGLPVVVGASRKSFLGWVLGSGGASERLEAGLAAAVVAARGGAAVIRTHDVGPTVRALALADALPTGRAGRR